ncbi:MAG: CTP--phosphocholine cytidylyltransferase, partial [Clostridium perfringens]|nr:CTP--phosphocholine cytidylyltransferase [Clostridium perfringens]
DDIVKNNISKLDIRIEKISENSIYEIDNLEELDYVKSVVEI